jgi:hypothetical protein
VTISYLHEDLREIFVFRKEEVFKVILHELIHALRIDYGVFSNDSEQLFMSYFNAANKLVINESYTDTLACILNICIYSVCFGKIAGNERIESMFSKLIRQESIYILQKAKQVLDHSRLKYNNKSYLHQPNLYVEDTHALSYYVLKSLNFFNLNKFFWRATVFKYVLRDEQMYIDMLMKFLSNRKYWDYLSKINVPTKDKSLRMSSIDLQVLLNKKKDKLLKTLML